MSLTYGYITKNTRIQNNLPKTQYVDARCISGNPQVTPLDHMYYQKRVRRHNRQLHKATIPKGGCRKANQAAKYVYGYRLFDQVKYKGKECFVFGRRTSGYFDICTLDNVKVSPSASYKKLHLLTHSNTVLTERRPVSSHN